VDGSANRTTLIIAAIILIGFGTGLFYMPVIMNAIGAWSPVAAGVFAVLFVGAFFAIFWLRARHQRRKR
jgi:hypothetical protein